MFLTSINPQLSEMNLVLLIAQQLINSIIEPGVNDFFTGKIHLYTSIAAPPSPSTAIGDVTEATFDGYNPANVAAAAVVQSPNAQGLAVRAACLFTASSTLSFPETILGYYVTDSAEARILLVEQFEAPVPITTPFDFISLVVLLPIPWSPDAV